MPTLGSVTQFFPRAVEGFTTTLASTISAGTTTLTANSTSGYSVGDVVVWIIDPASTTAKQVFTGTVQTSNIITGVVWTTGTNQTHTAGATIVDYTTATGFDMHSLGILKHANQDGSLSATAVQTAIGTGGITNTNLATGISSAKLFNPYKFSAYNSSTTTIAASFTPTKIAFQTEEYDTGNNYDNATNFRFVAPVAGFYSFYAVIQSNSGGTGDYWLLQLYKNGVAYKSGQNAIGSGTGLIAPSVSPPPMLLAANDFIEVYCSQNGGATHTTTTGAASTYFGGYIVSLT